MVTLVKQEEMEDIKLKVYEYIKANSNCTTPDLMRDLNLTENQVIYYIKYFVSRDHVTKTTKRNGRSRKLLYNIGTKAYARKLKASPVEDNYMPTELHPKALAVATVYKLLDTKHNTQPKAKHRRSDFGSMQSGIAMFGSW